MVGGNIHHHYQHVNNLAQKVDQLIVGGGIANTFLLAAGYKVGKSLAEPELVDECKKVLETLKATQTGRFATR